MPLIRLFKSWILSCRHRRCRRLTDRGVVTSRVVTKALVAALMVGGVAYTSVFAHSQQEMTEPAEGAVLESSPSQVAVRFDHAMRFAWFRVEGPQGEVELLDAPPREAVQGFSAGFAAPCRRVSMSSRGAVWRLMAM